MTGIPHPVLGLVLALVVGFVLGLLGGGGSILALPIFLYVFLVPVKPAIAMSLVVVGMSALVGFVSHWRQGTVALRIALPFGAFAMLGAYLTARLAHRVPAEVQLGLFAAFAVTAAVLMLRDSLRSAGEEPASELGNEPAREPGRLVPPGGDAGTMSLGGTGEARTSEAAVAAGDTGEAGIRGFGAGLALQAVAVGTLTSLIGAGGGFVIVPALVLLARVPVRQAVGSSLLIIAMNAMSGFVGYIGQVPIAWRLVGSFTGVAAVGALVGTRLVPHVPQARIKQGFAVMILVLGAYFALRKLGLLP